MARPRLFSIAPGVPFLPTFVEALLAGRIAPGLSRAAGPFALADATIYVPTRRAARALLTEFARACDGATLLPKIRPLGAVDEEAELFAAPEDDLFGLSPDIPEAVGEIERRFVLADLVLRWSRALRGAIVRADPSGALVTDPTDAIMVGATPADAMALAGDLAALIDEFIVEGAPWFEVRRLAAEDYDGYWGITAKFLRIAIEQWPNILAQRDRIDAADRRARLIEQEIARLQGVGAHETTIVLGSTGTNRATARLMRTIARLQRGAVVLPGLDDTMPEADWRIVGGGESAPAHTHPQAALARLMERLDASRADVEALGEPASALELRRRFVSRALAPTEATADWLNWRAGRDEEIATALAGIDLIEAADEREEALAIAIRLRAVLETPDATAALITPDRSIARRVSAELARWGLEIDDSGGDALGVTRAGAFARLALAAAEEATDASLAALLAHESAAPTQDRADSRRIVQKFEIAVLRATPHDPDVRRRLSAARGAAADRHAHPAVRRLGADGWRAIEALALASDEALAPLRAAPRERSLADWVEAHRRALALLSLHAPADEGDDALALDKLFDDVGASAAQSEMRLGLAEYARLFDTLAASATVRGPQRSHSRLKILGLLEARLLDADLIVLAGLDETIWPPQTKSDAFLNRPMRAQIGLTPPERRIGQSAHDFVMALGAPQAVLTRALKRGGAPTVASRFLQRIAALAGEAIAPPRTRGEAWSGYARGIDAAESVRPVAQPQPKPPLDLRPKQLSVTRIETLRRDPYAIFAERILKLAPAGALDAARDAAEQGTAIHRVLKEMSDRWPSGELPADAHAILVAAARETLAEFFADPTWRAFRWPGVQAGIAFALDYVAARGPDLQAVHAEISGRIEIALKEGEAFLLTAQADRLEIDRDGRVRVVDYKTGAPPSMPQVKAGLAPQLTLEAAMARAGAFESVGQREPEGALYIKIGGKQGGDLVEVKDASKGDKLTFAQMVDLHWAGLKTLLESYRDPQRGYPSRPLAQFASRYSDYDHLARVKEWAAAGGGEGGE